MDTLKAMWQTVRWVLVGLVLAWIFKRALAIAQSAPGSHNVPFERLYGSWRAVLIATAFFLVFVLGFARP